MIYSNNLSSRYIFSFLVCLLLVSLSLFPSCSSDYQYCDFCEEFTKWVAPAIKNGKSESEIETIAEGACIVYEYEQQTNCDTWNSCQELCDGLVSEFAATLIDIQANTTFSAAEICYVADLCPDPSPIPSKPFIPVPSNLSDTTGQTIWPNWNLTSGTGYFFHLSDIHIDTYYTPGTNSQCDLPLCCREEDGKGDNSTNIAGPFGAFKCDTPPSLLYSLLDYITSKNISAPDFVIYTGDDPSHDIWNQTNITVTSDITYLCSALNKYFPLTPVFSAVGNHEITPVDEFGGPSIDSWLYKVLSIQWAHNLPIDAIRTIKYGGYYQTLVRPGLRLISLNTNVYATGDDYTKYNMTDFSYQLYWLEDVLKQVAELNEKAIIIGHSNPTNWFEVFAVKFSDILERYELYILNLYFGHAHTDSVVIFATNNNTEPVVTSYMGGSVTPYTSLNPGFRIDEYDRDPTQWYIQSYLTNNYYQYWFDLIEANNKGIIEWSLNRNALVDYGLTDLSPESWFQMATNFVNKLNKSQSIYQLYEIAHYKGQISLNNDWESIFSVGCDILDSGVGRYGSCSNTSIEDERRIIREKNRCDLSEEEIKKYSPALIKKCNG